MHSVLWLLRTIPSHAIGEIPFFLVYGAEVVLPAELMHSASQVTNYDKARMPDAQMM